jgi:hypothetical protein
MVALRQCEQLPAAPGHRLRQLGDDFGEEDGRDRAGIGRSIGHQVGAGKVPARPGEPQRGGQPDTGRPRNSGHERDGGAGLAGGLPSSQQGWFGTLVGV